MRRLALMLLVACSSTPSQPQPQQPPQPQPQPQQPAQAREPAASPAQGSAPAPGEAVPVGLADLISADAIGVLRTGPELFSMLLLARKLLDGPSSCWTKLEQGLVVGYQISVAASSYFILEGDLPRAAVEACIPSATRAVTGVGKDGELTVFDTPEGALHAAWRGRHVVVGSRKHVDDALRTPTRETVARWRELVGPLASAPAWMVRTDGLLEDLLGGPTTSYELVIDRMEKQPRPLFAGRFNIRYASPADAERGARWIKGWIQKGKFPRKLQAPPEVLAGYDRMVRTFQQFKIARHGVALELRFDSDMFGGPEHMSQTMSQLAGQLQASPP